MSIVIIMQECVVFIKKKMNCHFTDKKHHHDTDDDSGMGPSIFTDTKSTTFSEVSYYLLQFM